MHKSTLFLAVCALAAGPAAAGPADNAAAAVTHVIDQFNAGDINAFFNAHRRGALIVDEFAPYVWTGPNSVQRWAGDYAKDARTRGISGGRMDYARPIRAISNGGSAYVILPTTYRFTQRGKRMAGKGSMTFVMTGGRGHWKIASWTYSGAVPAPE